MLSKTLSLFTCIALQIFLLQACTPIPKDAANQVRQQSTDAAKLSTIADLYDQTVAYCQNELQSLEKQKNGISVTMVVVAVVGAALGAAGSALLAASAANSATAAFFSSAAGVASGVQPAMAQNGITADVYKTRYDTAVTSLQADMVEWSNIPIGDAHEIDRRMLVLEKMKAHCTFMK